MICERYNEMLMAIVPFVVSPSISLRAGLSPFVVSLSNHELSPFGKLTASFDKLPSTGLRVNGINRFSYQIQTTWERGESN